MRCARRVVARVGGLAVVTVVAVGLTPSVAAAAPPRPSDTQVADARAAADAVQARIGELSGQLAAARDTVEASHAASIIALDEFQATQTAYEVAEQQAGAAAAAAAQATAELDVARRDVARFARRSYMQGSTYPGAAALIAAADPGQLVERAALLEAAGAHRSDVVATVTVRQVQATVADQAATSALVAATVLQEQAAASLQIAQDAEMAAREQAAALSAQQIRLETELATAQQELRLLVGDRAAADRVARVTPSVTPPPTVNVAPVPSGDRNRAGTGDTSAAGTAIDAAMRYVGTPYAWGGGGTRGPGPGQAPDEAVVGFDCSGLTQYAYAQAGITIPRNSRAQYSAFPKVSSNDLRAGDLVFWATDPSDASTIYHVALYLGGGRVVQAPQSGDVVKVSDMWWKGYAGAVRPSA